MTDAEKKAAEEAAAAAATAQKAAETAAAVEAAKKAADATAAAAGKALSATDVQGLVDAAVAPLRRERELETLAEQFGLDPDQAKLVAEFQQKHNLAANEAFLLARHTNKDKFTTPGFNPRRHGLLPPSGTSPNRTTTTKQASYQEKIAGAKDGAEREQLAKGEFRKIVLGGLARHYGVAPPS